MRGSKEDCQNSAELPEEQLSWELRGAGFAALGAEGKPARVRLPRPGEKQALFRVDAVSLCFSDVKLIQAGNAHPRLEGRDLANNPTRPGHEAALTAVAVGAGAPEWVLPGKRYLLQPDIYIRGKGMAFGYAIPGALSQYTLLPEEVFAGDEGCYLLPLPERAGEPWGCSEVALLEPWACVEAAYSAPERSAPRAGGRWLVCRAGTSAIGAGELAAELARAGSPRELTLVGFTASEAAAFNKEFRLPLCAFRLLSSTQELSGRYEDIILLGASGASEVERMQELLGLKGHLLVAVAEDVSSLRARIDLGRMHYESTRVFAVERISPGALYRANSRRELFPGGRALLLGAGGPMGQMHLQRALQLERPPRLLVATDIAEARLAYARQRWRGIALQAGVELVFRNPGPGASEEAFWEELQKRYGGFEDIVVLAPLAALVERAASLLARGGVLNLFAGLAPGKLAELDLAACARRNLLCHGTSGSRVSDLRKVLEKGLALSLASDRAVAAVGGLKQALEGLRGVAEGKFPGKVVLYPSLLDYPLSTPEEIAAREPEVGRALELGRFWSARAEAAFLKSV